MKTGINIRNIYTTDRDVRNSFRKKVINEGIVSIDIETSGLDWQNDRIGSVQIMIPGERVCVVKVKDDKPENICNIINNKKVEKVFHHALFDLRFMAYKWKIEPKNIKCTKIASKIINTGDISHSLKDIVKRRMGVDMDKSLQKSDWLADEFSNNQLMYAAKDVFYLKDIFKSMENDLRDCGRYDLAEKSFDYIPTRLVLDLMGAEDIFTY